jgi:sRNA-binding regulator protein Hfq
MSKRISPDISTAETMNASVAVLEPPPVSVSTPPQAKGDGIRTPHPARKQRSTTPAPNRRHFTALPAEDHGSNHQAELFYLQKQIQLQTQMVFILEDGARIQGVVEWYDRNSIKVRGKSRVLIYKSAIKYLYKAGEVGSGPGE